MIKVFIEKGTGALSVLRLVEEMLFEIDQKKGAEFFWRGRETKNISGYDWTGYDFGKIKDLAFEFGIDIVYME